MMVHMDFVNDPVYVTQTYAHDDVTDLLREWADGTHTPVCGDTLRKTRGLWAPIDWVGSPHLWVMIQRTSFGNSWTNGQY